MARGGQTVLHLPIIFILILLFSVILTSGQRNRGSATRRKPSTSVSSGGREALDSRPVHTIEGSGFGGEHGSEDRFDDTEDDDDEDDEDEDEEDDDDEDDDDEDESPVSLPKPSVTPSSKPVITSTSTSTTTLLSILSTVSSTTPMPSTTERMSIDLLDRLSAGHGKNSTTIRPNQRITTPKSPPVLITPIVPVPEEGSGHSPAGPDDDEDYTDEDDEDEDIPSNHLPSSSPSPVSPVASSTVAPEQSSTRKSSVDTYDEDEDSDENSPDGFDENVIARKPDLASGKSDLDRGVGNGIDNSIQVTNEARVASFFAQPGILAAVIGGAVLGLLFAVLLVMFILYRIRKKDEGVYTLEDPKRVTYTRDDY